MSSKGYDKVTDCSWLMSFCLASLFHSAETREINISYVATCSTHSFRFALNWGDILVIFESMSDWVSHSIST